VNHSVYFERYDFCIPNHMASEVLRLVSYYRILLWIIFIRLCLSASLCLFNLSSKKNKMKVCELFPCTVADKKNYRQLGKGLPHANVWNFKLYIAPIVPNHRRLKAGSLKFRLNSLKLIIMRIGCFGRQSIVFSSSFNRLPQAG